MYEIWIILMAMIWYHIKMSNTYNLHQKREICIVVSKSAINYFNYPIKWLKGNHDNAHNWWVQRQKSLIIFYEMFIYTWLDSWFPTSSRVHIHGICGWVWIQPTWELTTSIFLVCGNMHLWMHIQTSSRGRKSRL